MRHPPQSAALRNAARCLLHRPKSVCRRRKCRLKALPPSDGITCRRICPLSAISAVQYVFADVVQQEGCGVFVFRLYEDKESGDDFADKDFLQGAGIGQGVFLQEAADVFGQSVVAGDGGKAGIGLQAVEQGLVFVQLHACFFFFGGGADKLVVNFGIKHIVRAFKNREGADVDSDIAGGVSAFKTLRAQEFLQHLRGGVSVFRGEGFDDVRLHQLMGDGCNGRNGMADVAVKNLGNLMAAPDFAAFVIDESDVVADVSFQVFKGVFHNAVRHADQLQAAADKDVLERAQTGSVAWESFITAVAGISASMRLTA